MTPDQVCRLVRMLQNVTWPGELYLRIPSVGVRAFYYVSARNRRAMSDALRGSHNLCVALATAVRLARDKELK